MPFPHLQHKERFSLCPCLPGLQSEDAKCAQVSPLTAVTSVVSPSRKCGHHSNPKPQPWKRTEIPSSKHQPPGGGPASAVLTSRSREGALTSFKDVSNRHAGGSDSEEVPPTFLMLFCLLILSTYCPHKVILSLTFLPTREPFACWKKIFFLFFGCSGSSLQLADFLQLQRYAYLPCGSWVSSSPNRDQNHVPTLEDELLATGSPGKFQERILIFTSFPTTKHVCFLHCVHSGYPGPLP